MNQFELKDPKKIIRILLITAIIFVVYLTIGLAFKFIIKPNRVYWSQRLKQILQPKQYQYEQSINQADKEKHFQVINTPISSDQAGYLNDTQLWYLDEQNSISTFSPSSSKNEKLFDLTIPNNSEITQIEYQAGLFLVLYSNQFQVLDSAGKQLKSFLLSKGLASEFLIHEKNQNISIFISVHNQSNSRKIKWLTKIQVIEFKNNQPNSFDWILTRQFSFLEDFSLKDITISQEKVFLLGHTWLPFLEPELFLFEYKQNSHELDFKKTSIYAQFEQSTFFQNHIYCLANTKENSQIKVLNFNLEKNKQLNLVLEKEVSSIFPYKNKLYALEKPDSDLNQSISRYSLVDLKTEQEVTLPIKTLVELSYLLNSQPILLSSELSQRDLSFLVENSSRDIDLIYLNEP